MKTAHPVAAGWTNNFMNFCSQMLTLFIAKEYNNIVIRKSQCTCSTIVVTKKYTPSSNPPTIREVMSLGVFFCEVSYGH